MAAALKLCVEELVHDLARHVVVDETAWHHQYVGIVVLTDQVSDLGYPAKAGANALVLVERHADALTATAHGYAWIDLAFFYALGQLVTELGIVAALLCVCAVILVLKAFLLKVLFYELLQWKSSMVACYTDH